MIYTFYSYKGGVGRSMALANVGELFYQAGLNVLLVDWDLEAPGLERFFGVDAEEKAAQPGVMDMLLDYKQQMMQESTETEQFPFKKPSDLVIDLHPNSPKGRLWLLTAGKRDKANFTRYANAVLTFDWKDFYDNWEGEAYFEWLRQQFLEMADVVLIDSRTGITEMGGVCTYQLGDVVVMFCGTSRQNLEGTVQMVAELKSAAVEKARGRSLEVIIVPARVDKESGVGDEFKREFLRHFAQYTPEIFKKDSDYFWQLTIPYATVCAYKEMIVTPESSIGSEEVYKSFTRLTFALSRLAPASSAIDKALPETEVTIGSVSAVGGVVGGNIIVSSAGGNIVSGDSITINHHNRRDITLAQAQELLASLPLDTIPDPGALPPGSRMPFAPNPLFIGREPDLQQLARTLKGEEGRTVAIGQIAAATGLGGIGKTQLASEFAHRYGSYFAGGVFWLNFADPQVIPAEIAACGGVIGMDLSSDFGALPLADQVRLVLSAWQSPLPRLLIFDNCEDERLLAQWRPPTGGARVLITSRRAHWNADLGVQALPLDVLARPESITLLCRHRSGLSDNQANAIADELGDLPLALHLAGSFLATYRHAPFGAPAAYLEALRAAGLEHISMTEEDKTLTTGHAKHVGQTFALSYARLDADDLTDALALALLARAACFAPGETIPRALLLATLALPDDDVAAQRRAEDSIARLTALGLLDEEAAGDLRLHRLLVTFVRGTLHDDAAQAAVEETVLDEARRLNQAGYPAPLLAWQPHLRHITDTTFTRTDERAAGLCNELGHHLWMIGEYPGARPYYERALTIREPALGPDHPDTALLLNSLAALYDSQERYGDAESCYGRALAILERALGPDHPDVIENVENLSALYRATNREDEALKLEGRASLTQAFAR